LTAAQKKWIAYQHANCPVEDQLAFGGASIGGNHSACLWALSLSRLTDFVRMPKQILAHR
jgi:hypothetical protein